MAELKNSQGFSTRAIHAGQRPDPTTGAVMTPIYATSTYAQESPGVNKGYEYARGKNPTREAFEACIADLEGGVQAFGFGSGMAATSTALELLDAGSHIVTGDDLYGGSWRLFERVRRRSMGLDFAYVDLSDLINRKYEKGDVVVAGPGDTLDTAFKRMKGADVSQLPIIRDGRLVGILDESDLVHVMNTDEITRKERFAKPVSSAMTRDLDTVQVSEPLDALIPLFDRDRVAIVLDGETFVGLIARVDLINHLSLNR